jgi:hypothetical protein
MMNTNETVTDVTSFFESYRLAFERLDASAIADHFAYPSHVTSDTGRIVLSPVVTKPDWTRQIEQLLAMYRAIGFASARILNLAPTKLSPRLVQTTVDWALQDNTGSLLYTFQAAYTLAKIDDAFRISAIAHNEIPRYRESLARLESQHALKSGSQESSDHDG